MRYTNDRRSGRTKPNRIGVTEGRAASLAGAAAKFGWELYELPNPYTARRQAPRFVPNRADRRRAR